MHLETHSARDKQAIIGAFKQRSRIQQRQTIVPRGQRLEIQEKNSASNGVAPVAVELPRDAEKILSFLSQEHDDLHRAEACTKKELSQLRTVSNCLEKWGPMFISTILILHIEYRHETKPEVVLNL